MVEAAQDELRGLVHLVWRRSAVEDEPRVRGGAVEDERRDVVLLLDLRAAGSVADDHLLLLALDPDDAVVLGPDVDRDGVRQRGGRLEPGREGKRRVGVGVDLAPVAVAFVVLVEADRLYVEAALRKRAVARGESALRGDAGPPPGAKVHVGQHRHVHLAVLLKADEPEDVGGVGTESCRLAVRARKTYRKREVAGHRLVVEDGLGDLARLLGRDVVRPANLARDVDAYLQRVQDLGNRPRTGVVRPEVVFPVRVVYFHRRGANEPELEVAVHVRAKGTVGRGGRGRQHIPLHVAREDFQYVARAKDR